jgi:hypothetical protein
MHNRLIRTKGWAVANHDNIAAEIDALERDGPQFPSFLILVVIARVLLIIAEQGASA